MKRHLMVVVAALVVALFGIGLWAEGAAEPGTLVLALDRPDQAAAGLGLTADTEKSLYRDYIIPEFERRTGIKTEIVVLGTSDGTNKTAKTRIEAGERIDVMFGYAGRIAEWATPDWAIPLSAWMSQQTLDRWIPGALQRYKDGRIYWLPETAWCQAMVINDTLAEKTGLASLVPKDGLQPWAIADYMQMVQKLPAGTYGTTLFATQTSGDYWQLLFISGFGAKLWENGKVVLDTPEGREAVQFLVDMQRYAPKGAAGLSFQEMMANWQAGISLLNGGSTGWGVESLVTAYKEGKTKELMTGHIVVPPSTSGHAGQVCIGPDGVVVFKTTKNVKGAVQLAEFLTGPFAQSMNTRQGGRFPTIVGTDDPAKTAENPAVLVEFAMLRQMMEKWGVFDLGIGSIHYGKVRELWSVMLQQLFSGQKDVAGAVADMQREANATIEQ